MVKVVCRTVCGAIELNVTLADKQLAKPLTDALLTPFLGAYNKKRPGEEPLTAAATQHARRAVSLARTCLPPRPRGTEGFGLGLLHAEERHRLCGRCQRVPKSLMSLMPRPIVTPRRSLAWRSMARSSRPTR
jgi:hypothetical protein